MAERSFFFTNFPNEFQEKDLWRVFQHWGRVLDVFISKKLNARKQRFGFVRFHGVRDEYVLERQLDSIWIGTWKLHANIPKYRRQGKSLRNPQSQTHSRKIWREITQQRSYAQAVRGGNAVSDQKGVDDFLPNIRVNAETSFWLERCFIGKLLKVADAQTVKKSFILGGFNLVRVRYLGERYVLLSCEEEGLIERLITDNKEWFEGIFGSIVPWDDSFVVAEKIAWFRCRGIPLTLWSNQCFEHIGALIGKLEAVDEGTVSKEVLEYARLRIRLQLGEEARLTKSVRINDRVFQVYFEEENSSVSLIGSPFHKWNVNSEEESEARIEDSVGEGFSDSDYSEHGGRQEERRGEEMTVQFPAEEEEFPKVNAYISGGINSVGKSQNVTLESRKEKVFVLETAATCTPNNSLSGTKCGKTKDRVWAEDLICSGSVQAQLSAESWVGETLISDPIADVDSQLGLVGQGRAAVWMDGGDGAWGVNDGACGINDGACGINDGVCGGHDEAGAIPPASPAVARDVVSVVDETDAAWEGGGDGACGGHDGACGGHDGTGAVLTASTTAACNAGSDEDEASMASPVSLAAVFVEDLVGSDTEFNLKTMVVDNLGQRLSVAVADNAETEKEAGDGMTSVGGGATVMVGVSENGARGEGMVVAGDGIGEYVGAMDSYPGSDTGRGGGKEVNGGGVVAGVIQAEGKECCFDEENKGSLRYEATAETTSKIERMGLIGSREDDGVVKMSTPRGTIRESEKVFASHPVGRMMASFGRRTNDLHKSRDGSSPRFERLSKSDSLKGLRSEIIISDSDVRKYSRMFWIKDEQGEARRRWKVGREMGFTLLSEEEVVLNRLSSSENPDCRNLGMEINVSDDESN